MQETTELMKELREKKARIEDKKRQYLTKKPEGMEEHLARLSATEDKIENKLRGMELDTSAVHADQATMNKILAAMAAEQQSLQKALEQAKMERTSFDKEQKEAQTSAREARAVESKVSTDLE